MATKKAQIIIEVDDKSLLQLNSEIKLLEEGLNDLKIGTQEWQKQNEKIGTLKDKFNAATGEAAKLQGQVAKISSAQQIQSISKLGSGMVGAFATANGALSLLGNNEAFEKMTATATTLMATMGGLNQVAELFSTTTLDGLGAVRDGFKTTLASVRTASTGMKAALISTGIGAIVVLVGLLIANWQKLKNVFNGSSKEAKKLVEETKRLKDLTNEQVKAQKILIEGQYSLNNGKSDEYNTTLKTYELNKLQLVNLDAQIDAQKAVVAQLQLELLTTTTLFGIGEKRKRKRKQDEIDAEKAILQTLEAEKQVTEEKGKQDEFNASIAESQEKYNQQLNKLEAQLIKVNAKEFNTSESYALQLKQIDEQIKKLKEKLYVNGQINIEIQRQLNILNAQRDAFITAGEIQRQNLQFEIETVKIEIQKNQLISRFNDALFETSKAIQLQNEARDRSLIQLERSNLLTQLDYEGLFGARKIRDEIVNFDVKRNKILKERTEQLIPSEVRVTKEAYAEMKRFLKLYSTSFNEPLENIEFFAQTLKIQTEIWKDSLIDNGLITKEYKFRSKYGKQILDDAAAEFAIKKITNDLIVKTFDIEILTLEKKQKLNDELFNTNSQILLELSFQRDEKTKQLEFERELYDSLSEKDKLDEIGLQRIININALSNDLVSIKDNIKNITVEITNTEIEQEAIGNAILDTTYERDNAANDVWETEQRITADLVEKLRLSTKLKDFTAKYKDEIRAVADVLATSTELLATGFDNAAARADKKIQGYQDTLDALADQQAEIEGKEADRKDELIRLEEELKDAGGARYDQLSAEYKLLKNQEIEGKNELEAKQDELNAKVKKEEDRKAEAEFQAARWRKRQSIADGIIATALAVIKALPNVFLSVAAGIAGGLSVATIASQQLPERPESKYEGGFTSRGKDYEVAGLVHKNEYVVPSRVVQSPSAQFHIAALERQRNRGFIDGGFTTPNLNGYTPSMDYDLLITGIADAISKLPNPQVGLVNISQGLRNVELTKSNAGLNR